MLDIGFWEICVVVLVTLLIVKPEHLPRVARTIGKWLAKIRRLWANVSREASQAISDIEINSNTDANHSQSTNKKS